MWLETKKMEEWDILSRVFDNANIRSHPAMMDVPLTRDRLQKLKDGYLATPRSAHGKRAFLFISSCKEDIISVWYYPKLQDPLIRGKFANHKFSNNVVSNNEQPDVKSSFPTKHERVCHIYNRKQPAEECTLTILDVIIKDNQHQIEIIDVILMEDLVLIHRGIELRKDIIRDFLIRFANKSPSKFKVQPEMEITITSNQRSICGKDDSLRIPIEKMDQNPDQRENDNAECENDQDEPKHRRKRNKKLERKLRRKIIRASKKKNKSHHSKKEKRSRSHSRSRSLSKSRSRSLSTSRSRSHSPSKSISKSPSHSRSRSRSYSRSRSRTKKSKNQKMEKKSSIRSISRSKSHQKESKCSDDIKRSYDIDLEQTNWNFFDASRTWPLPRFSKHYLHHDSTPNFWDCIDTWLPKMCATDDEQRQLKQTPLYIGQWELHAVPFFQASEIGNLPLETCFPQSDSWVFIKLLTWYGRENTIEDACFKWKSYDKNKITMNFKITRPEHGLCVTLHFIGGLDKRYNKKYTSYTKGNMILNVVASHDQVNPRCLKFAFVTLPDDVKESFDENVNVTDIGEFEWSDTSSKWEFIRLHLDPDEKITHVTDAVKMINQANGVSLSDILEILD